MKSLLVRNACRTAYYSGLLDFAMAVAEPRSGRSANGRFQILTYHRVSEAAERFAQATPAAVFEAHMRYLCRRFRVLPLADLVTAAERREVPARAIAITFDDGYEDTYTHAYPILRRYGVPATVYLATGFIDQPHAMWNDRIAAAVRDTSRPRLEGVPGHGALSLHSEQSRHEALGRTLEALKRRPLAEREELTARIVRSLNVPGDRAPRMLRWEQIRQMAADRMEFGAHTVNHPILTALPLDEARREIVDSKEVIEERLRRPVLHFAYPNGKALDFNEPIKALVRAAGFASAVSTLFGTNTILTDRYALRRGGSWEPIPALFATKLWWYRRAAIAPSDLATGGPASAAARGAAAQHGEP